LGKRKQKKRSTAQNILRKRTFIFALLFGIAIPTALFAFLTRSLVFGQVQQSQATIPAEFWSQYGLGLIGAAIAVAGSCLGAGIAISGAASAGMAAIVERPETSIWVLILAGLGEGVAIYGLLIAILIMGKLPSVV
jgi:F0F1-type ATP synthase membrane subunit c/vacuolar-type H+-ATPase subunit K